MTEEVDVVSGTSTVVVQTANPAIVEISQTAPQVVEVVARGPQGAGSAFTISDTPPTDPKLGDRWLDSSLPNGVIEYTWVIDADSAQWVDLGTDATGRQGVTQLVDGATITIDLSDMAKVYEATIAGDRVFAFIGAAVWMTGHAFFLDVIQGAGGNRIPDLSACTDGDDVTLPITFSTAEGKRDLVGLTIRYPNVLITSYSRGYQA